MHSRTQRLTTIALALGAGLTAGTVSADHNSIWGEGWATDAMDMHAAAIERVADNGSGNADGLRGERQNEISGTPRGASRAAASTPVPFDRDAADAASRSERLRPTDRLRGRMQDRPQRPQNFERPQRPDRAGITQRPQRPERPQQMASVRPVRR